MNNRCQGFTIVELTIAVAFLSVLMLAILTISMAAGKMYVKGDTNKAINQAGRDFSDIIRRDFLAAGVGTITPPVIKNVGTADNPLISGRMCLGTVDYLWNTAALLNSDSSAAEGAKIRISDGSDTRPIKFVRITNSPGYCSESPAGSGNYPMVIPATADTTELFGGSGREYALYNMSLRELARSDQRGIYQLSYTLGTNERDTTELVPDANGTYVRCKTDDNVAANFNYCSVSDFDTLIRIGGVETP